MIERLTERETRRPQSATPPWKPPDPRSAAQEMADAGFTPQPTAPKDRILIVSSAAQEQAPFTDLTWATQRKYAKKHGYDFVVDVSNVNAKDEPTHFGEQSLGYIPKRGFVKLDLMLHYLDPDSCKKNYDWVVWLDSDLLITKYDIPLEHWLDRTSLLLACYDFNSFNATVIAARADDLVYDLLHMANTIGRKYFLRDSWAEMNSLRFCMQMPPYQDIANLVSVKELCAIPPSTYPVPERVIKKYEWDERSLAVHFSAMGTEDRARMAREYVERLGLL